MFDKLVESTKQNQGKRARRLFFAACVIYAVALTAFGVMSIIGFNPALAEGYNSIVDLIPPPVPPGPLESLPKQPNTKPAPRESFAPPKNAEHLPPLDRLDNMIRAPRVSVPGETQWSGPGREWGGPGAGETNNAPPPPPPTPTPVVKPAANPTPDQQVVRLTSMITQGRALRKIEPSYPAIARQARVQGSVQVQISISEAGEVTDVTLLSGHPLLRDAAMRAAKQWLFIPTELNGRPVRAIGVITFNFKFD
jgi:periplasmic protein TonB